MSAAQRRIALTVLQWTLAIVILTEAILFVLPSSRLGFAQSHMPDILRIVLGWGEIIACVLLLIPRTTARGAWILLAVFGLAILIHLLHGMHNVGNLMIYAAATWVIAANKEQ